MPRLVIPATVQQRFAGDSANCSERTSRNRQHGLAACNVLALKTSERKRKHTLEEAPHRWFIGVRKHFPPSFSTNAGCRFSTESAEDPKIDMSSSLSTTDD